jgi:hypothetical protein
MTATYLTPKRYRTLGSGIALPDTDAELVPALTVASAMVNTYCAAPVDHDFRGGSVTDEQHPWESGNAWRFGSSRVYPYHKPIRSASKFQVDITNEQRLTLDDPVGLYINKVEGWIEPVALALTSGALFGWSIMPNINLVAKVDYEYGWRFTATDEQLASVSGGELQALNQFWFTDTPAVIKQDGNTLSSSQYTVDSIEGRVTVSGYDSASVYAATYEYPLPPAISQATGLIATDILAQAGVAAAGLNGLSYLRVEEIEIRQSSTIGLYARPVNAAAAMLLTPYIYQSWG